MSGRCIKWQQGKLIDKGKGIMELPSLPLPCPFLVTAILFSIQKMLHINHNFHPKFFLIIIKLKASLPSLHQLAHIAKSNPVTFFFLCADKLFSSLNDQQKDLLEKFDDCYNELTDINEREIFSYAFKLGMQIAIEVLYD